MKHLVLFCAFFSFSFICSSENKYPLLLESAEDVYKRNARDIQVACIDCLNFIHKKYPGRINPEQFKSVLANIGQSQITTEETRATFVRIEQFKKELCENKKREKEDRQILEYFGVIDNGSRKISQIR